MLDRLFPRFPLERVLLFASVALGLLHAWVGRYSMNVDGMSYLEGGTTGRSIHRPRPAAD